MWRAVVSEPGDFDRVCPSEWSYVPSYDEVLTTYWRMNISTFPYLHQSPYFRPDEDGNDPNPHAHTGKEGEPNCK